MSLGNAITLMAERLVTPVEGMHRAIARPWFRALGTPAQPVRVTHDAVSQLVYSSIRLGVTALGLGIDSRSTSDTASDGRVQAFVNGLWGDTLGRHEPRVGTALGIRDREGGPVQPGPALAEAFPDATGRLVVLLHGLTQTERCWQGTKDEPGWIAALDDHPETTPVAIRYNSGLSVARNGELLAELLADVHANWPVPVESIALVGHSMGGLVIGSACSSALDAGHDWIYEVRDVVTIGTPHRGAPLEKLVNAVSHALRVTPQTRPLGEFLDSRSQGIKDLRWGGLEEPSGADVELLDQLPDIRHHFAAGVITSDPAHPVGAVVGDLMVRPASSTSAASLDPINVVVLGGVRHFDLLNESELIDHVMGWITSS